MRLFLGLTLGLAVTLSIIPAPVLAQCDAAGSCDTALGKIDTSDPAGFVKNVLTLAIGIGGAIALLLMLYGLFIIITSSGIPDKIKAGQEIITSAVAGLIFIVLSVVIFKIVGVDVLAIPGLGK